MIGLFSSQSWLSHNSVIAQSWSRLSIFFTESTQSPALTSTAGTTNTRYQATRNNNLLEESLDNDDNNDDDDNNNSKNNNKNNQPLN